MKIWRIVAELAAAIVLVSAIAGYPWLALACLPVLVLGAYLGGSW